jgi:hypothetical protein
MSKLSYKSVYGIFPKTVVKALEVKISLIWTTYVLLYETIKLLLSFGNNQK